MTVQVVEVGTSIPPVQSVAGRTGAVTLTKGDVGLGSVDNTADLDKPISTAQAARFVADKQLDLPRWDDFTRPDGRLDTSLGGKLPSGQAWNFSFAAPATAADLQIVDNKLRLLAAGASYMWTTGVIAPTGATVEFAFEPGDNTGGPGVALCFSKQVGPSGNAGLTGVATNSVHCVFSYGTWSIGIFRNDGTGLIIFGNGVWTVPPTSETRLRGSVRLVGPDRVEVTPPGGDPVILRDRRIPQFWGSTVLIEHFQPSATYATNARPIILGHTVERPVTRDMPLDSPVGGTPVGGIPGANCFTSGTLAYTTGITKYTPIEVTDPVTITAAYSEVTVAATAGETMRLGICEANENWQPTRLLLDLGTKPADAVGVQGWTGLSQVLSRGRYLLAQRVSAACTLRYIGYSTPGAGGVRAALLSTAPYVQALQVSEAYGAFVDPPTAWTVAAAAGNSGWISPAALTWTGA